MPARLLVQAFDRKLHAFDAAHGLPFNLLMGLGAAAACGIVAIGLYVGVERPLTAWLRQRLLARRDVAAPASQPMSTLIGEAR